MPRGDQSIRQHILLRALFGFRHGATLDQMAEALPPDSPKHHRTIRRDLEALERAGFPIVTDKIDGKTRWRLMEGFRDIPPVSFSEKDLMALTIARGLLLPLRGTEIGAALDNAFGKVRTALPPATLPHLDSLSRTFSVGLGSHKKYAPHGKTIETLSRAMEKKRTVQIRYRSHSRGKTTRREVSPYHLWLAGGALYLIGHCHVRGEVRLFAVDRIASAVVTDNPYSVPFTFDAREYMKDAFGVMRGKAEEVDLLFEAGAASWVGEKVWHTSQAVEKLPRKRLRLKLNVAVTPELASWVTSFGGNVEVIRPRSLREAVRKAGEEIVRRYGRE